MIYKRFILFSSVAFSILVGASLPVQASGGKSFSNNDLDEIESQVKNQSLSCNVLYKRANQLRHDFNNQRAIRLSDNIYNSILDNPKASNKVKALVYRCKGKILIRDGNVSEGIRLLEIGLTYDGSDAESYIYLGNIYSSYKKDSKAAIDYYQQALKLTDISELHKAKALIGLGNARYNENGKGEQKVFSQAEDLVREILKKNPSNLKAKEVLFQALMGRGNSQDGKNDYFVHYYNALSLADELTRNDLRYKALMGLGKAYAAKEINSGAMVYFIQAKECALSTKERDEAQRRYDMSASYHKKQVDEDMKKIDNASHRSGNPLKEPFDNHEGNPGKGKLISCHDGDSKRSRVGESKDDSRRTTSKYEHRELDGNYADGKSHRSRENEYIYYDQSNDDYRPRDKERKINISSKRGRDEE
jgi:tetratricopeptide (TPR) repeat protein